MNSMHDVGGMDGFPLPERDQGRVLKEEWERLVWGTVLASFGIPGVAPGPSRRIVESMPPAEYLTTPYYAVFLRVREQQLLEAGVVTQEELRNPDGPVDMPNLEGFQPMSPEQIVEFVRQDRTAQLAVDVPRASTSATRSS